MGKIIWLASYPKSGSTWLRAFLHNFLLNTDAPHSINEMSRLCTFDSSGFRYEKIAGKPVSQLSREEAAQLRPAVHKMMTEVSPDNVFAKTHNAMANDCDVPMITMDHTAGGIYIVRNPLDVVISLADTQKLSIDGAIEIMEVNTETENSDAAACEFRSNWSGHVEGWTGKPSPGLHIMRYEDMQEKPVEAFGQVAAFLGVKPPQVRVERAVRYSAFDELKSQETKHGFVERLGHEKEFFRQGKTDQWRGILSHAQVKRMVDVHRQQMSRFGYLPFGY